LTRHFFLVSAIAFNFNRASREMRTGAGDASRSRSIQ
jgi:hypothetical protein